MGPGTVIVMTTEQRVRTGEDLAALRDELAHLPQVATQAQAIDRIRVLEELKAAAAAAQARAANELATMREDDEAARGVPQAKRCRGLGAEIGLARRESPARGARFLGLARSLDHDLPHAFTALSAGVISEEKAHVLHRETSWLSPEKRRRVDEFMADRFDTTGVRRLGAEARAHAQRLDQVAAVEHLDRCAAERRVSVRPAPGGMAYLTALLPLTQAVAAYANLQKTAAAMVGTGEAGGRSATQTAADLLVERVTGQAAADAVPIEVQLVMTDAALVGEGEHPAWIPGHGPLPAGSARRMLRTNEAGVFLRRLFTAPGSGQLVGMDSRRREFTGLLRRLVMIRDDVCRSPFCDAPIRHIDHATPYREGGATDIRNASGLCAACNYAKENPGWIHAAVPERLTVRTPTGHRYSVDTPPMVITQTDLVSPKAAAGAGARADPTRAGPAEGDFDGGADREVGEDRETGKNIATGAEREVGEDRVVGEVRDVGRKRDVDDEHPPAGRILSMAEHLLRSRIGEYPLAS